MTSHLPPETTIPSSSEYRAHVDSPELASRPSPLPSQRADAGPVGLDRAANTRTVRVMCLLTLVPVMVLGIAGYSQVIGPLYEKSLVSEAAGLARDLDAMIRTRAIVLDQATRDQEMTGLLETAALDKLRRTLGALLPDFVSIDVIDRQGAIMAMAGELPTSGAGLPVYADTEKFIRLDPTGHTLGWVFHDDAAGDCFYLSSLRTGKETTKWFLRACFSRASINEAAKRLSTEQSIRATLVPVAAKNAGGSGAGLDQAQAQPRGSERRSGMDAQISRSWWGGVKIAQIGLETPGWALTAENTSVAPWFSRGFVWSICLVVVSILGVFIACRAIFERTSRGAGAPKETHWRLPWRSPDKPTNKVYGTGAFDLKRSESWMPRMSFNSEPQPSIRPVGEGLMDESMPEAEFLTQAAIQENAIAPAANSAFVTRPGSADAENQPETRAISWFEPLEAEDQSAPMIGPDPARESSEDQLERLAGAYPEYIEVEWLDDGHESPESESELDEKTVRRKGSTKVFVGA